MILTYDMLSPGQKKWVLMVNTYHPEIKDQITFDQIHKFHHEFLLLREKDNKFKVGLPGWLIQNNRIDKGVYFFPDRGNEVDNQDSTKIVNDLDSKYQQYLSSYGLTNV